jgi:hypothetical protein
VLSFVPRKYSEWDRKVGSRILRSSSCEQSYPRLSLWLVRRWGFSILIKPVFDPSMCCCLISSISAMHESPGARPPFQISCQRLLPAQSHLFFLAFLLSLQPPEQANYQYTDNGKKEEVVVENEAVVYLVCVRVGRGGQELWWRVAGGLIRGR